MRGYRASGSVSASLSASTSASLRAPESSFVGASAPASSAGRWGSSSVEPLQATSNRPRVRPRSGWRTARAVKPPEQMREVLRLQVPDETYHAAFGALLADLSGPKNRGYELAV